MPFINIYNEDARVLWSVPVVSRFISETDDRNAFSRVNAEYYYYLDEFRRTGQRLKGYEKEAGAGILKYAEKEAFLYSSPEYRRWETFKDFQPEIEALQEDIKNAGNREERKMLETMLNLTKTQLVEQLRMQDQR